MSKPTSKYIKNTEEHKNDTRFQLSEQIRRLPSYSHTTFFLQSSHRRITVFRDQKEYFPLIIFATLRSLFRVEHENCYFEAISHSFTQRSTFEAHREEERSVISSRKLERNLNYLLIIVTRKKEEQNITQELYSRNYITYETNSSRKKDTTTVKASGPSRSIRITLQTRRTKEGCTKRIEIDKSHYIKVSNINRLVTRNLRIVRLIIIDQYRIRSKHT